MDDLGPEVANPKYLETFLGGMETSGRMVCGGALHDLETFLGGMETLSWQLTSYILRILETFLGGMETALSQ